MGILTKTKPEKISFYIPSHLYSIHFFTSSDKNVYGPGTKRKASLLSNAGKVNILKKDMEVIVKYMQTQVHSVNLGKCHKHMKHLIKAHLKSPIQFTCQVSSKVD